MLNRQQVQSFMACLPDWCRNYAALHMDTIPKLVNHVLILLAFANLWLFLGSWSVVILPDVGFNTPLIAFLLCCQNGVLWMTFNPQPNTPIPSLQPTEFMVGNCLGITIGAALLAMVFSNMFRNIHKCDSMQGPVYEFICGNPRQQAHLASTSFWSGLVFWLEFCLALLIALGRHELVTAGSSYEDISAAQGRFSEYQQQSQQQQQQQQPGFLGTFAGGAFAGGASAAYSTVPDINNHNAPPDNTVGYHNSSTATPQPSQQSSQPQSQQQQSGTINNPLGNV